MTDFYTLRVYTREGMARRNVFEGMKVLHVGCGNAKLPGALGVDKLKLPSVDVAHNLDVTPWPFDDDSMDVILAHSVLEHIDSVVSFFNETSRVLKKGGRIIVCVPYFRSVDGFTDPTHKRFFTSRSLDYFLDAENSLSRYGYSKIAFKKIGFWHGWPQESRSLFVRIFKKFIIARPWLYDQYISLLFPVKILVWELEVRK